MADRPQFKPKAKPKPKLVKEEVKQEVKPIALPKPRHKPNRKRRTSTPSDLPAQTSSLQPTRRVGENERTIHKLKTAVESSSDDEDEPMGNRAWSEVNKLVDSSADRFDALRIPYIPATYQRVDKDVTRHFIPTPEQLPVWGKLGELPVRRHALLFQLPVKLPLKIQTEDETTVPVKTENGEEVQQPEKENILPNPFKDVKSGRIGKLEIRQSGKTYLILGHTRFLVGPDVNSSFFEEFVQIRCTDAEKSYTPICSLAGRVIVKPDIQELLRKSKYT